MIYHEKKGKTKLSYQVHKGNMDMYMAVQAYYFPEGTLSSGSEVDLTERRFLVLV